MAPLAVAQYNRAVCAAEMTAGTYVVTCSGFITAAANAVSLPFTVLGLVTADSTGFSSGTATNSVAGTVFPQNVAGQSATAPDCSGTIREPKTSLNVKYAVLFNGDEIRGIVTDKGANVACNSHPDETLRCLDCLSTRQTMKTSAAKTAPLAGPLTSARFSVSPDASLSCASLCPSTWSCDTCCRPRVLTLQSNDSRPIDALQVTRDLMRDGLTVFACREAPHARPGNGTTFVTLVSLH